MSTERGPWDEGQPMGGRRPSSFDTPRAGGTTPHAGDMLRRLTGALALENVGEPFSLRLCSAAVGLLDGDGGAITLSNDGPDRTTLCATTDIAAAIEDLEEVLGAGPGVDSFRAGAPVTLDLGRQAAAHSPPTGFAAAALPRFGAVFIHARPLRTGPAVIGTLTVYQEQRRAPTLSPVASAQLAILVAAALVTDPKASTHESPEWSARSAIHQATGMAVAQARVPPADAIALLRAYAYASEESMDVVARQVLSGQLSFTDWKRDGNP